ncbi:MAG: DinB family protein [Bacteroidota bacterium]
MHLHQNIHRVFSQLHDVLNQLSGEQYTRAMPVILNATIGQHLRHIIELFIQLDEGYTRGTVNYDKRRRDHRIETDLHFTNEILGTIRINLDKKDKPLLLEMECEDGTGSEPVATNYYRELIYNLEHAVHHMALIRIGVNAITSVNLPEEFGLAASTIKYRSACAQ